ncbi:hypothetical protein QTP88_018611 [Uroleucon formosanum]
MYSNFSCLSITIKRLQKQGILLSEAIEIVQDISTKFSQLTGTAGTAINKKLQTVLNKNKGFQIMCNISKILTGEKNDVNLDIPEDLTSSDMTYFKFVPMTSSDVERSFSLYKTLLASNRRSFKFENLKKSLVIQCNNYFKGTQGADIFAVHEKIRDFMKKLYVPVDIISQSTLHLNSLKDNFNFYFIDEMEKYQKNIWVVNPFQDAILTGISIKADEELIDISEDTALKLKFN